MIKARELESESGCTAAEQKRAQMIDNRLGRGPSRCDLLRQTSVQYGRVVQSSKTVAAVAEELSASISEISRQVKPIDRNRP